MPTVVPGRMTAELDGDFVVFLIGMRANRWWKVHKWLPVVFAMQRMVRELAARPEVGCLHTVMSPKVIVQYWRSFEQLEAYARDPDATHWPAWKEFNRRIRASSGDVGIWHETYVVRAGDYETLYASMPRHGLAMAGRHVPVRQATDDARQRLHPIPQG